jgi:hypothetical protein
MEKKIFEILHNMYANLAGRFNEPGPPSSQSNETSVKIVSAATHSSTKSSVQTSCIVPTNSSAIEKTHTNIRLPSVRISTQERPWYEDASKPVRDFYLGEAGLRVSTPQPPRQTYASIMNERRLYNDSMKFCNVDEPSAVASTQFNRSSQHEYRCLQYEEYHRRQQCGYEQPHVEPVHQQQYQAYVPRSQEYAFRRKGVAANDPRHYNASRPTSMIVPSTGAWDYNVSQDLSSRYKSTPNLHLDYSTSLPFPTERQNPPTHSECSQKSNPLAQADFSQQHYSGAMMNNPQNRIAFRARPDSAYLPEQMLPIQEEHQDRNSNNYPRHAQNGSISPILEEVATDQMGVMSPVSPLLDTKERHSLCGYADAESITVPARRSCSNSRKKISQIGMVSSKSNSKRSVMTSTNDVGETAKYVPRQKKMGRIMGKICGFKVKISRAKD